MFKERVGTEKENGEMFGGVAEGGAVTNCTWRLSI